MGVTRTLAGCFLDRRNPDLIDHSVRELLAQRVYALALGYEDLNDHTQLRRDPLLAAAAGKEDVLGLERRCSEHRGTALASPATLNRLELGSQHADHYRKLHADPQAVEAAFLSLGVRCLPREAQVLVLDFDATDDPLHGRQENRFFHGYYDSYCYLPLFCFCGDVCLWAQLRTADRDGSDGTLEALIKIVAAIRARMPGVILVLRADSGFAREPLMAWCEAQRDVHYRLDRAPFRFNRQHTSPDAAPGLRAGAARMDRSFSRWRHSTRPEAETFQRCTPIPNPHFPAEITHQKNSAQFARPLTPFIGVRRRFRHASIPERR